MNDPYPPELLDELPPQTIAPNQDALIRAVNRLAEAVEQLALASIPTPTPVPSAQATAPAGSVPLAALPPVQTVANTPSCAKHGVDKVKPSTKPGVAFYCTAKDPQGPRGWCASSWAA